MGKAWLIASGKGGVGKSMLASSLGCALAKKGKKVCIVDADIGLRDQDALLGVENRIVYDVMDVADKNCGLSQALVSVDGCPGLTLLPAAQFSRVKELSVRTLSRIIERLKSANDYVLIDCPAGIERGLRTVIKCQPDGALIVCTADDVCIRNAERAAGLTRAHEIETRLIVNRLQSDLIRSRIMYSAAAVAQVLDLPLAGEVPEDPAVCRALLEHHTLMETGCEASRAVLRIASRLDGEDVALPCYGSEKLPWYRRLFRRKEKLPS